MVRITKNTQEEVKFNVKEKKFTIMTRHERRRIHRQIGKANPTKVLEDYASAVVDRLLKNFYDTMRANKISDNRAKQIIIQALELK